MSVITDIYTGGCLAMLICDLDTFLPRTTFGLEKLWPIKTFGGMRPLLILAEWADWDD